MESIYWVCLVSIIPTPLFLVLIIVVPAPVVPTSCGHSYRVSKKKMFYGFFCFLWVENKSFASFLWPYANYENTNSKIRLGFWSCWVVLHLLGIGAGLPKKGWSQSLCWTDTFYWNRCYTTPTRIHTETDTWLKVLMDTDTNSVNFYRYYLYQYQYT